MRWAVIRCRERTRRRPESFWRTIGIGAGAGCDGQILVYQDMLGMFSDFTPKFVRRYGEVGEAMKAAFASYIEDVGQGTFPGQEHGYQIADEVIEKLY